MKTNYLNKHVFHPVATDKSPNKIGTVVRVEFYDNRPVYHIQFRDFKEYWSATFVRKNLAKF